MHIRKNALIIAVVVVIFGSIVAGSAGAVTPVVNKGPGKKSPYSFVKGNNRGYNAFKDILPELVKDGTISQGEADRISAYMDERHSKKKAEMDKIKDMTEDQKKQYFANRKGQRKDIFSDLVADKIITKEKADAIKAKLREKGEAKREERIKNITTSLDKLVKDGTISKEQENKIIENIKVKHEEKTGLEEKVKNMTSEERKNYFEKQRAEKKGFLSEMVEKGELTKEQADAIRKVIKNRNK